jgi:hypothetical protein
VGTYTIAQNDPLRLGAEVTHPQGMFHISLHTRTYTDCDTLGAVCGAGDLNDNMKKLAMLHLKNQRYLTEPIEQGLTIENLVDSEIMPFFENEIKRAFSLSPKTATFSFRLRGLQTSASNPQLKLNAFVPSYQDMLSIFQECFDTIDGLMRSQITHALSNNINVNKNIFVGGFGNSPALKQFLTASLVKINKAHGTNIILVTTAANTSAGAVATGGVVRAQNKENGPKRVPRQSIRVIRHVPDEPETYSRDVLSQGWELSETDGEYYNMRTIQWIIKVVSYLPYLILEHLMRLTTFREMRSFRPFIYSHSSLCIIAAQTVRSGWRKSNCTRPTPATKIGTRASTSRTTARLPGLGALSSISHT